MSLYAAQGAVEGTWEVEWLELAVLVPIIKRINCTGHLSLIFGQLQLWTFVLPTTSQTRLKQMTRTNFPQGGEADRHSFKYSSGLSKMTLPRQEREEGGGGTFQHLFMECD